MSTEKEKFFQKMKKGERPFGKGKTVAFSWRNICCPGLVFHREDDSKPKFQVFLVEISGIEPLTS